MTETNRMRLALTATLAVMFMALAWRLFIFSQLSAQALQWPYELDYSEGIVWQQADLMFTRAAYGPIDGFPSIVFHYTPLYHVVVRGVVSVTGLDTLFAGRVVSLIATLLTAGIVAQIVMRAIPADVSRKAAFAAATGGALTIFCCYPLAFSALVFRVDMLAILLSFMGFWLGLKTYESPEFLPLAVLSFVAAVYTKQTAIAAPAALFGVMLFYRPKMAWAGITLCLTVGLVALGTLSWITDGGFPKHIFLYNVNRIDWSRLYFIVIIIAMHGPFFGVAAMVIVQQCRAFKARGGRASLASLADVSADFAQLNVLAYLITASFMLVTLAKMGSFLNYFVEWLFVLTIFIGIALSKVTAIAFEVREKQAAGFNAVSWAVFVPIAIALQAMITEMPTFSGAFTPSARASLDVLSARVRTSQRPVISDEMVLLKRSGKSVVWEPMIFRELVSTGAWDERPFLRRIYAHEFEMFIMGNDHDTNHYSPAVIRAVNTAYPLVEHRAAFTIHLPRGATPLDDK